VVTTKTQKPFGARYYSQTDAFPDVQALKPYIHYRAVTETD